MILYGSGEDEITFTYDDGLRHYSTTKPFEGVIPNIERRWRETESAWVREELSRFQSDQPCEACDGYRLKPEALAVKIDGLHIGAGRPTCRSARPAHWFATLPAKLTPKQNEIAERILKEIRERLNFLERCRPRLSHAGARLRHAVRRREPAHPARLADRLRPHRRALCARRAVDRAASARQCAAARNARPAARSRQHRHRRRA